MGALEPRLAWLGISLQPRIWRYCYSLSTEDIVNLYELKEREISALLRVGQEIAGNVAAHIHGLDFDREERRLRDLSVSFVSRADRAYPRSLDNIYDPPAGLFYRGELNFDPHVVAIVGSRRCTAYGQRIARDMGRDLGEANVTVVSGMARGIDTAAHEGACESGRTVAVLGSGPDILYPPENRTLAKKIADAGALLSEYPPGTPPLPLNFPARNRIISALSSVVVIVEASRESGALITADFALEHGKDVMVVPGSVNSPVSSGCHALLKQGAGVAETAKDVFDVLGFRPPEPGGDPIDSLTRNELAVLELIEYDRTHMDTIMSKAGKQAEKTLGDLSMLEARGLIGRQAGGWYYRLK